MTVFITEDAIEMAEISDDGQPVQFVDDPDAADLRLRLQRAPTGKDARVAVSPLADVNPVEEQT
jgi:hypothetical protein